MKKTLEGKKSGGNFGKEETEEEREVRREEERMLKEQKARNPALARQLARGEVMRCFDLPKI